MASVRIILPTYCRAVLAQTTGVPIANTDCREPLIGGRRNLIYGRIISPTRRRTVFAQSAGMLTAALDYRELILGRRRRRNVRVCAPAHNSPVIPQCTTIEAAYTDCLEINGTWWRCCGRGGRRRYGHKRRRGHWCRYARRVSGRCCSRNHRRGHRHSCHRGRRFRRKRRLVVASRRKPQPPPRTGNRGWRNRLRRL